MKEILFRGKRVDNGEWVEGSLVVSQDRINYGKCYMTSSVCDFSYGDNGDRIRLGCFVEVIPETVCQFTGLRDKNGRRIFEGDILRISGCYFDVIYRNGGFVWRDMRLNRFASYANSDSNIDQFCFVEVIGNIHDNPELLEEL